MLLKRFDRYTDLSYIRANTRFSEGLDKARIAAIGDSVSPVIAYYLFECIKEHHQKYTRK